MVSSRIVLAAHHVSPIQWSAGRFDIYGCNAYRISRAEQIEASAEVRAAVVGFLQQRALRFSAIIA